MKKKASSLLLLPQRQALPLLLPLLRLLSLPLRRWPVLPVAPTLIPFLSGILPQLQKETQTIGELVELDDSRYYQMTIDEAGAMATVALNAQTRQADFDLFVGITPNEPLWSNTNPGSRETVRFVAPKAGDYYVWIVNQGSSAGGTTLTRQGRFTLTLTEDQTTPSLPMNERIWGHVVSGERTIHRLHVDKPDQLLTVILLGSDGTDLDLVLKIFTRM